MDRSLDSESKFQCKNGLESVLAIYKCDVFTDCDDGSDEEGCDYFTCDNGKKKALIEKCDKVKDCADGSDEKDCSLLDLVSMDGNCTQKPAACQNQANCTDIGQNKFVCVCQPGYSGSACETHWGEECKQPCEGEQCEKLKTKMLGFLDMTVDPCDDFFKFVCNVNTRGQYLPPVNEDIKDLERLVRTPPKGFEFVSTFFESCIKISTDTDPLEVLMNCTADGVCEVDELLKYGQIYVDFLAYLKIFSDAMAFPVVTPNWEKVTANMSEGQGWTWWDVATDILTHFSFIGVFQYVEGEHDVFMSNIFFSPMIETILTGKNCSRGICDIPYRKPWIHIVPMTPDLWMIKGDEKLWDQYKKFMMDLLGHLSNDKSNLEKDITRIIDLEKKLKKINNKPEFANDDDWEVVGIFELYYLVPFVEWKDFISKSLSANKDFQIEKETKVAIPSRKLMKQMGEWIREIEVNRRDQANLVIWRMIVTFAQKFMHEGPLNIFKKINPKIENRVGSCLTQVTTFFPGVKDELVVAEYMDTNTKTFTNDLWKGLQQGFLEVIRESTWMTQRTRLRAEEKLKQTKFNIGESMPITKEFNQLKKLMSSNYIINILNIGNYHWGTRANSLEDGLKEKSSTPEDAVAAYYDRYENAMTLLTGLIKDWLTLGFSQGFPAGIIYGSFVGSTIGHELTHGFDNKGRKFDKDGFPLEWWEPEDSAAFENLTNCMVSNALIQISIIMPLIRWISMQTSTSVLEVMNTSL